MTIPLVTMLGLFAYVAITSITNYNNLNRAPNLIRATAEQATKFVSFIQQERRDAMVYLSDPTSANLTEFEVDAAQTKTGAAAFDEAMTSPQTRSVENADESAAIDKMISSVSTLNAVRPAVEAHKITATQAFEAYTNVILAEPVIFQAEASSMTDGSAVGSGLGLISTVNEREDVDEQDAIMAGVLASGVFTPQERVVFDDAAGRQQDDAALYAKLFNPAELAAYNSQMKQPSVVQATGFITEVQQAVESGATIHGIEGMAITPQSWQGYTSTWSNANYDGGLDAADTVLNVDQGMATSARSEVILFGSLGLAGLVLTLIISIFLGQSVNRRLKMLRTSAAALATQQLPNVVSRLRRGETVDLGAEAPPLRVGSDEIGEVGQAIDLVRQTAIRSAVEESRLRQGVNDMFRNLARRNQSLLQRQLSVLDGMERRATDPDVLDDLFTMDHLTTRMRRHAEGLIILSGAVPGRSWSNPVKLIDVMRGAVAEVEDFARVTVSTQSRAMLSGNAVTDVIHLLAELIENATSLSPPFTQVRVSGESVSNGFAIEIEDRGLGLTPNRMAELNERLANPPDVNPANTEQLGLFVVGQLAKRHGITVMLRPSPYGGTTAVALVPQRLVVDDSKPVRGSGPVAIGAGPGAPTPVVPVRVPPSAEHGSTVPGNQPFGDDASSGENAPFPQRKSGMRGRGSGRRPSRGTPLPAGMPGAPGTPTPVAGVRPGSAPRSTPPDLDNFPLTSPFGAKRPPLTQRPAAAQQQPGTQQQPAQEQPAADIPVVTGVPVSRPTSQQSPDYFTRPAAYGTGSYSNGHGATAYQNEPHRNGTNGNGTNRNRTTGNSNSAHGIRSSAYNTGNPPYNPGNSAYGIGNTGYGTGTPATGNGDSAAVPGGGNNGGGTESYGNGSPGGADGEVEGLPKRVRQANLAPQLRASRAAGTGNAEVPQAAPPNPADVRNTFSAMQRGWQQGRSQQNRDTEGNK
ncbi:MAG: nitrate- and nitrite sensing domain-containing protein [Trebonia sp.]